MSERDLHDALQVSWRKIARLHSKPLSPGLARSMSVNAWLLQLTKCEAKLNALPQFITEIDGLDIH